MWENVEESHVIKFLKCCSQSLVDHSSENLEARKLRDM